METVLICVAPDAGLDIYQFFEERFKGPGWEPYVIPATEVAGAKVHRAAAVVAHASYWPQAHIHNWLADIRETVGPRNRVLAILPHPPHYYPEETQTLWNQALGYGYKINAVIEIIDDFIAGRS